MTLKRIGFDNHHDNLLSHASVLSSTVRLILWRDCLVCYLIILYLLKLLSPGMSGIYHSFFSSFSAFYHLSSPKFIYCHSIKKKTFMLYKPDPGDCPQFLHFLKICVQLFTCYTDLTSQVSFKSTHFFPSLPCSKPLSSWAQTTDVNSERISCSFFSFHGPAICCPHNHS